jgi:(p)ppGpp synthase/HD superfamily hydrolase
MILFSGRFQPSGKDFLSHCVGTSSILASLHLPVPVVSAGLIHNVYQNGDFGNRKKFISKFKRKYIRKAVGDEVEEYVAQFATSRWDSLSISNIRDRISNLSMIDRNVILLRIADNLEHLLDLDVLYYAEKEKELYLTNIHLLEEIAVELGFPKLTTELKQSYKKTFPNKISIEFSPKISKSYNVPPRSYRKRWLVRLVERMHQLYSSVKLKKILGL